MQRGRNATPCNITGIAVALDSTFRWPLAQAALAAMTSLDPYGTWADSVLSEVHSARDRFAPLERNLAEYAFAIRATDWETCYRAIRAAAAIAPEQYSYQEAVRALNLSRPGDAVVALRRPALSRVARSGSLNYWRLLSSSYHALGDHRHELDALRAARAVNPANPGLRLQELKALSALGMIDQVLPRLDSLVGQPREEWITAGTTMVEVARELRAHGHEAMANETLARAVAWFRQRPTAEAAMPSHQYFLGEALYLAGDLEAADSLFRILAERHPDQTDYLGYVGVIAARRGDRSTVKRVVAMLRSRKPVTPLPGEASLVWRATIEALSGNQPEAMRLLVEAFGPRGTFDLHASQDFEGMRDYAPFREFIRPKG
jgi:tetratricopeptide (TPR) repeat protein